MMKKTEQQKKIIDSAEEAAYQIKQDNSQVYYLILGSLISADNTRLSEDTKQDIIRRMKDNPDDLAYILYPLGKDAEKYYELLKAVKP